MMSLHRYSVMVLFGLYSEHSWELLMHNTLYINFIRKDIFFGKGQFATFKPFENIELIYTLSYQTH